MRIHMVKIAIILLTLVLQVLITDGALPNTILEINPICDAHALNTSLKLAGPFKGILFAKDFSQECRIIGEASNSTTLSIPTRGCGVRLVPNNNSTDSMALNVVLVLQQDRHLRQIADQERLVQCAIAPEAFQIRSPALDAYLAQGRGHRRNARMMEWRRNEALMRNSRAWMEIGRGQRGRVQVGDELELAIKTTLPVGVGWQVVDCIAHDGLGDNSQKLLNEQGCPIDESLLPKPVVKMAKLLPQQLMQHQEAISRFPAFKFPDRDRLHLVCGLQICKGNCPLIDCKAPPVVANAKNHILDRIEVFNSIEIYAPGIDDLTKNSIVQIEEETAEYLQSVPLVERTFCISPDTLALAFCGMGLVFLCALFVSVCALVRARRQPSAATTSFYTRSGFSSSATSGSGYESKLLQSDNNSSPAPYGRIL